MLTFTQWCILQEDGSEFEAEVGEHAHHMNGSTQHRSGPNRAKVEYNDPNLDGNVNVDFSVNNIHNGSNPDVPAEHKIKLLRGMRKSFHEYVATNHRDLKSVRLRAGPDDPLRSQKAAQYQRIAQQTADATGGTVEHHPLGSTVHWASK